MKQNKISCTHILISLSVLFVCCSCNPIVTGEGPVVDVKKDVDKFAKVDMEIQGDVIISQGTDNSVIVHAQKNIADAIETTVSGKTVKIYSNKNLNSSEPITIDITMNDIEGLDVSGSGIMKSSGTIKSPDLSLKVSGSGKMFIDAVCNKLSANISGSGEVTLKGSTTESDLKISGSGELKAYELLTENAKAEITGSGNAHITATAQLTAKISGSGDIRYKGKPAKVEQNVSGSGTIKPAE